VWVPVAQTSPSYPDHSVVDGGREQSFLRFPGKIRTDFQCCGAEEGGNLIVIHF
jgi:hypothetical protein